jgi:hypothetical protein
MTTDFRAALAAPEQGPTDEEIMELMPQQLWKDLAAVSRLAAHGAGPDVGPGLFRVTLNTGIVEHCRAVLTRWGRPAVEPVPAITDEEVDALVISIQGLPVPDADDLALPSTGRGRDMVRRALARWGRPAVEPVPVAERLPGPEDRDVKGRCWWLAQPVRYAPTWVLQRPRGSLLAPFIAWAPHWALPLSQEGE